MGVFKPKTALREEVVGLFLEIRRAFVVLLERTCSMKAYEYIDVILKIHSKVKWQWIIPIFNGYPPENYMTIEIQPFKDVPPISKW